ncbi:MAG: enoyl-CoA hydratase-related protein, partial [Desulfobacterales bacterium]|nr:enoyl-CoA hydratase-related protein [Desulfobacterales bacterium]
MAELEFYRVEKKGQIAWVYLNRPEKKNAMNPPAWEEPVQIFEDLNNDDEIRVVVLAGEGPCFSAGIDLVGMMPELPELMEQEQKG